MMKRWIMICDKYYVSMDFDRWAKQVCTDTRECQYPLTNLHHGIISSLLVIFCKWEIQNEEFIFYCLLFVGKGTAKLGIVHETKGQMYLALLPPS